MDIDQEILAAPETAETTGHHKKGSYDFVHEYICSLSSQEERESFRNRCEEVLAKREKGTVAIGSLSSTRTVKKTRTTKTSFQPCVPTEFDNLLRLFSKFWMEMFCTANSSGPCQQLQAMGPECVDTFLCTQQMIGDLVIRFVSNFPYMLPSVKKRFTHYNTHSILLFNPAKSVHNHGATAVADDSFCPR